MDDHTKQRIRRSIRALTNMFALIVVQLLHQNGVKDHMGQKRKLHIKKKRKYIIVINFFTPLSLCNACGLRWAKKNKKRDLNDD
ncbi:hypothetical protein BDF21DRAFT_409900 [Thamnidium elegans]|nr:hypothetical protein BDF21DRAFT_409900 [Thamnidium elegans]